MTLPRSRLIAVRLGEYGRLRTDVDVTGVLLGDVDEDSDHVDFVDHVDRRGTRGGPASSPGLALRATITPS